MWFEELMPRSIHLSVLNIVSATAHRIFTLFAILQKYVFILQKQFCDVPMLMFPWHCSET
jgi:hypothetical protein